MPRKVFIGIDPGVKGGLVALVGDSVEYTPMPRNYRSIFLWLKKYQKDDVSVVIEKVWSLPFQSSKSNFSFGKIYGALLMALDSLSLSPQEKAPQTWMKAMAVPKRPKEATPREGKNLLRKFAKKKFPKLQLWEEGEGKQLAVCDALLIALYCKKVS